MSITIGDALLYLKTDNAGLQSGMAAARKTATTELRYMAKSVATDLGISQKSLASFASFAGSAALGIGVAVGGAAVVAGVAKQAYTDLILPTVDYALEVGDLSTKIGVNAEESSKLIQIMDDLRIENGTMLTAFRKMNDNGIQPTIENLKKASDEYRAIVDPVEKARFAAELFGARAGPEMQKLLEAGGEALEQYAQDAKSAGTVITDMTVQNAKDFYAMRDSFEDTVAGLKIQLGTILMPIATSVFGGIDASIKEIITDFGDLETNGVPTIFKVAEAIAQAGHDSRETTVQVDSTTSALGELTRPVWEIALEDAALTEAESGVKRLIAYLQEVSSRQWGINVNGTYVGPFQPGVDSGVGGGGGGSRTERVYDKDLKKWFIHNLDTGTYTPGQHGLHGIIPPGFPDDSFRFGATSGEEVIVKTKEQQKEGGGGKTYIYNLTAQYGFQSERSLRDDIRVLELLHG